MKYLGEIKSLYDLEKITKEAETNKIKLSGFNQYYRGHSNISYRLTSYLSRKARDITYLKIKEKEIIEILKRKIWELGIDDLIYIPKPNEKFHEDWYWLSQAQHLGIPTRLLDWSLNSKVALYFAVSSKKNHSKDGDFWIFFIPEGININNTNIIKPFKNNKDIFINIPIYWNNNYVKNEPQRNILSQQGKFILRAINYSFFPLEKDNLYKKCLRRYRIPAEKKVSLMNELASQNYTEENIYKTKNSNIRQQIVGEINRLFI